MSDAAYFVCLGVTVASAIAAAVIVWRVAGGVGSGPSAILLAVSANVGVVCALPFGRTREVPWLPEVAFVFFGSAVSIVILCVLFQIRTDAAKGR